MTKKKTMAMNRAVLLNATVFFVAHCTMAQTSFRAVMDIEQPPRAGFYTIPATAELSALSRPDNADIRIKDADGKFVPYIFNFASPSLVNVSNFEMQLLQKETIGKYTTVTFQRPATYPAKLISGIDIWLRNTQAARKAALSGSMDGTHWFAIKEEILLQQTIESETGTNKIHLAVTPTEYAYFRLKVFNNNADPLDFTEITTYDSEQRPLVKTHNEHVATQLFNPDGTLSQIDSGGISTIILKNRLPYFTDQLYLTIVGPVFFQRQVSVFIRTSEQDTLFMAYPAVTAVIKSGGGNRIVLPGTKAKEIVIRIANEDNQPVKVVAIKTSQKQRYLIAWLESGIKYAVVCGNDKVAAPKYDLAAFKDSIPQNLPVLHISSATIHLANSASKPGQKSTSDRWLWPVIVFTVIILGIITFRLVKDAGKKLA